MSPDLLELYCKIGSLVDRVTRLERDAGDGREIYDTVKDALSSSHGMVLNLYHVLNIFKGHCQGDVTAFTCEELVDYAKKAGFIRTYGQEDIWHVHCPKVGL